jgi:gamma-glutamylcyclotransferase (GGCT)/AIG2-like uncharacterized protein YtfP
MAACVDLFVYGTLMDERCLFSLTGRSFPRCEAKLPGFERIVPKTGYPYIVPKASACVRGILLSGVDQSSLAILDQYEEEGYLYHRRSVEAVVDGRCLPCETYVGDVKALQAYFSAAPEGDLPVILRTVISCAFSVILSAAKNLTLSLISEEILHSATLRSE